MATIRKDLHIPAPPASVWAALSDFGAVHQRVAPGFVTSCEYAGGSDRTVTFAGGGVARERLVTLDHDRRRLVYTVVEGRLRFAHHQASVEVLDAPTGGDGCRLVWITDVLPDEHAPVLDRMMDAGAAAMTRHLSGLTGHPTYGQRRL